MKPAMQAAAHVYGCDPGDIFIEVQGDTILVKWRESMKHRDKWPMVKEAVRATLPRKYRTHIISIV